MPLSAAALPVSADDQAVLRRWANATQAPATLVRRAKILLLAAEGVANSEIAERLEVSRPTVIAWRKRYAREGLTAGLADRHRRGRPQSVRRDRRAEILATTLSPPPQALGVTHWSRGCWLASWASATARGPESGPSTTSGPGRPRRSSSPPIRNCRPGSATWWSGWWWRRRRRRGRLGRCRRWAYKDATGAVAGMEAPPSPQSGEVPGLVGEVSRAAARSSPGRWRVGGRAFGACCFAGKLRSPAGPAPVSVARAGRSASRG